MTEALDTCGNCGRTIGKLEEHRVARGHVVCYECDKLLRRQAERSDTRPLDASPVDLEYSAAGLTGDEGKGYVDRLFWVRIALLVVGLFFWPVLIAWAVLGIIHLVRKSEAKR